MNRICCLFISLLLSGCGLEDLLYLNPPENPVAHPGDKTFTFYKTLENSELEFRGFEIYYKFYTWDQYPESNITDRTKLENTFNRISRYSPNKETKDNISKPLIFIPIPDRSIAFEITIHFSIVQNHEISATDILLSQPIDIQIRRGVAYNEGIDPDDFKYFDQAALSEFKESDADVSAAVWPDIQDGNTTKVALYALSYGKKDLIEDVYSVAVYLGEIDIIW